MTSVTDPGGDVSKLGYDSHGNLTSTILPDASTDRVDYDAGGLVTATINANGERTSYIYNATGLITDKLTADGNSFNYIYDAHRNLLSATDSSGTTSCICDAADRVTGVAYPNGKSIATTYDSLGRQDTIADQSGYTVRYHYDFLGRLDEVRDTAKARLVSYGYNAHGRRHELVSLRPQRSAECDRPQRPRAFWRHPARRAPNSHTARQPAIPTAPAPVPAPVPPTAPATVPGTNIPYPPRPGTIPEPLQIPQLGTRPASAPGRAVNLTRGANAGFRGVTAFEAAGLGLIVLGTETLLIDGGELLFEGTGLGDYAKPPVQDTLGKPIQTLSMKSGASELFTDFVKVGLESGKSEQDSTLDAIKFLRRNGIEDPVLNPTPNSSKVITPQDPNIIIGPFGAGADPVPDVIALGQVRFDGFVNATNDFGYRIDFENKPAASAPAQVVRVSQTLDADFDFSTFAFTGFGFGGNKIAASGTSFHTIYDATATLGVKVQIDADLNTQTGALDITYTSLDPSTNEVPRDPLAGFLPANDASGRACSNRRCRSERCAEGIRRTDRRSRCERVHRHGFRRRDHRGPGVAARSGARRSGEQNRRRGERIVEGERGDRRRWLQAGDARTARGVRRTLHRRWHDLGVHDRHGADAGGRSGRGHHGARRYREGERRGRRFQRRHHLPHGRRHTPHRTRSRLACGPRWRLHGRRTRARQRRPDGRGSAARNRR